MDLHLHVLLVEGTIKSLEKIKTPMKIILQKIKVVKSQIKIIYNG